MYSYVQTMPLAFSTQFADLNSSVSEQTDGHKQSEPA